MTIGPNKVRIGLIAQKWAYRKAGGNAKQTLTRRQLNLPTIRNIQLRKGDIMAVSLATTQGAAQTFASMLSNDWSDLEYDAERPAERVVGVSLFPKYYNEQAFADLAADFAKAFPRDVVICRPPSSADTHVARDGSACVEAKAAGNGQLVLSVYCASEAT